MSFTGELFFESEIVFNDSVVDHDDPAGAIPMRMGVFFRRTAVSRPARVANSVGPIEGIETDQVFKVAQFALCPPNLEPTAVPGNRDAGGVIPAILKAL